MKKLLLALLAGAVLVSGSFFGVAPQPAKADTNSTIAIAAAAAAIIGVLAFDSSNRPYYVRGGRRMYVSNDVAGYYMQQRDPGWYNQHRGQWNGNRGQFAQSWNNGHRNGRGNYRGHGH